MTRFKYSVSLTVVLALALVFIGCAKPPEAEKSAAKASMDAAVAAGADKYAAADLDAAKKVWDAAEAQMKSEKYEVAKKGYIDAKAAFEKAAAGVAEGKKAIAAEVTTAVAALEESWKNLEADAKKFEKKMKDKKELWEADAKTFTEGLQAAKDKIAADPADAKAKAGELKTIIDKMDATLKENAAASAKPKAAKKEAQPVKK